LASKEDQIFALLADIQRRLSSLEARLRKVEDHAQTIRADVVTVGNWTREFKDRR
jgi:hypothetical protein